MTTKTRHAANSLFHHTLLKSRTQEAKEAFIKGFEAGAKWEIEQAWHKPEEKPEDGPVLAISGNSLPFIAGPNCSEWEDIVKEFNITKWAYIDDLLPQED